MAPRLALAASIALLTSIAASLAGCNSPGEPKKHAGHHDPGAQLAHHDKGSAGTDEALAHVAAMHHGGNGPWAVSGYRMGQHALTRLALPPQSPDLEVVHRSPRAVQFSCIADGASAATGASPEKHNLSMVEADEAHTATTYRKKSTGQAITLRPTQAFATRYLNLPHEKLDEAGREVMGLRDEEIFEEVKLARAICSARSPLSTASSSAPGPTGAPERPLPPAPPRRPPRTATPAGEGRWA